MAEASFGTMGLTECNVQRVTKRFPLVYSPLRHYMSELLEIST